MCIYIYIYIFIHIYLIPPLMNKISLASNPNNFQGPSMKNGRTKNLELMRFDATEFLLR